jgi:hypothetical protein
MRSLMMLLDDLGCSKDDIDDADMEYSTLEGPFVLSLKPRILLFAGKELFLVIDTKMPKEKLCRKVFARFPFVKV